MKIFDLDENFLAEKKATFTATEIYQQPATWKKTIAQIKGMKEELAAFISQVTSAEDYDVILTGAGTSEFVGNSLFAYLNEKLNFKCKSYGTTDIVQTPENYISKNKKTLLVSFGRSGNSPESIGAVDAAAVVNKDNLYNLFVTCNCNGELSKRAEVTPRCFAINLTPETHDKSFAMTSSYSNMYLATLLAFNLDELDCFEKQLDEVIAAGQNFLDNGYGLLNEIVNTYDFSRIVYLGANTLKGVSQESALKILELTAGKVAPSFDTPLGFRHGPKSVINDETLTVVYVDDNDYSRRYTVDLIKEMHRQLKGNKILLVGNQRYPELEGLGNWQLYFDMPSKHANVFLGFDYVMVAQVIALFKSMFCGCTPDNPCPTGEVNRVVTGVTLYDYSEVLK